MKYVPVVGLEVHIQAKTKSKMFCSCPARYFGKEPNTQTCPTCLGLPGALPTINKKALDLCIKLALALSCKINRKTKFDRKNYFYPDLPKGYQISQFDLPIGVDGYLEIDVDGDSRKIRISRVHQEEDTGKSHHEDGSMLIDFNKSGVPLIEVVTETDFEDEKEVIEFAKEIKRIVQYLDVSDANMEKGQMRFELNISMKESGTNGIPDYKVEVKNISSVSVLEKVINFEMKRQVKLLKSGRKPKQETRGLKDMTGETVSQRFKEGSSDYRYFPEPDLPPIEINDDWMEEISKQIIELPIKKRERFVRDYGLEKDVARIITDSKKRADWFEQSIEGESVDIAKEVGNWLIGDVANLLKKSKLTINSSHLEPKHLVELVGLHKGGKISGTVAKQVLEESFKTGKSPEEIVEDKGLEQLSDREELEKLVKKIIKQFSKQAEEYRSGKESILKFLVGQVMRETKGRANPKLTESILKEELKND